MASTLPTAIALPGPSSRDGNDFVVRSEGAVSGRRVNGNEAGVGGEEEKEEEGEGREGEAGGGRREKGGNGKRRKEEGGGGGGMTRRWPSQGG